MLRHNVTAIVGKCRQAPMVHGDFYDVGSERGLAIEGIEEHRAIEGGGLSEVNIDMALESFLGFRLNAFADPYQIDEISLPQLLADHSQKLDR